MLVSGMPPLALPGWDSVSNCPLFWWPWHCWGLLVRYFGNVPQREVAGCLLKTGVMSFWEISEAESFSHYVISEVVLLTLDMIYGCWADLGHLAEVELVSYFPLLDCCFFFFPLILYSLGGSHCGHPTLPEQEVLCFSCWSTNICIDIWNAFYHSLFTYF